MYSWSARRQFIYLFGLVLFVVSIISLIVYIKWPAPTCFDRQQNQNEGGVDCGGPCSLACQKAVAPLRLTWVRLIPVEKGKYDVIGQVENGNAGAGVRRFTYLVRLFDKDNILLTARPGETFANPNDKFYIFAGGIDTRQRVAVRAEIDIDENYIWRQWPRRELPLAIDEQKLISGEAGTRLVARVTNNSLIDLTAVPFLATLSDLDKNIVGVSMTMVDELLKRQSQRLIFTWPRTYDPVPVFVDILPRLNYFLIR